MLSSVPADFVSVHEGKLEPKISKSKFYETFFGTIHKLTECLSTKAECVSANLTQEVNRP